MFISLAHASSAAPQGSALGSLLPLILIFGIFYILLIRPQQKRHKEHQQTIEALKVGDKIVTAGGLLAVVKKTADDDGVLEAEIAQNVIVKLKKATIAQVLDKESAKKVKIIEPEKKKRAAKTTKKTKK